LRKQARFFQDQVQMRWRIAGGRLYDPASDLNGEVRDLFIKDGRIVRSLAAVDRVIPAQGQVVLPAGLDLRGQVATYGVHLLRLGGRAPSPRELGETYAALGYTHVHEPFLTLETAGYVHRQLAALPVVDGSASLVLNLRELDLWLRSPESLGQLGETLPVLLDRTRSLNLRVREPYVRFRQDYYAHRRLAPGPALEALAELAQGQNLTITLESHPEVLKVPLPQPRAFHLAALGPALADDETLEAALAQLERGATADLGLLPVPEEETEAAPLWVDLGGFKPLNLSPAGDQARGRRALALALEHRGSQLAFSGAGPLQAPDYPRLFAWLWDREARRQDWGEELGLREYSLAEWVFITRTLPARLLGLPDRGHLKPGARADVALYDLPPGTPAGPGRQHLGRCRTLLKAGEMVVDKFALVKPEVARATYYRPAAAAGPLLAELLQGGSFRRENLGPPPELEINWARV
jgi:formylmethanofuran dehydrogenase subunit A